MNPDNLLARLSYQPMLAVTVHMAGDGCRWSRAMPDDDPYSVFYKANKRVAEFCAKQRDSLESRAVRYWLENLRDLKAANGVNLPVGALKQALKESVDIIRWDDEHIWRVLDALPLEPKRRKRIAKEIAQNSRLPIHLYRPLCTVGLGRTDNLALFLADDFTPSAWTLEDPQIPIRQTSVSVCPSLIDLPSSENYGETFCDLKDIFTKFTSVKQDDIPVFSIASERPLMAVTYYRTFGSCNLGSGVLFQEAIMRAMRQRITNRLKDLRIHCDDPWLSPTDLESVRCSFLAPVGWADLCTVTFASNYTAIMSALDSVRNLRFEDLFIAMAHVYHDSDVLRQMVSEFQVHSETADWEDYWRRKSAGQSESTDSYNSDQLLAENHVFCSTSTTLAIEHNAFFDSSLHTNFNGVLHADPHFNVSPGHLWEIRENKSLKEIASSSKPIVTSTEVRISDEADHPFQLMPTSHFG